MSESYKHFLFYLDSTRENVHLQDSNYYEPLSVLSMTYIIFYGQHQISGVWLMRQGQLTDQSLYLNLHNHDLTFILCKWLHPEWRTRFTKIKSNFQTTQCWWDVDQDWRHMHCLADIWESLWPGCNAKKKNGRAKSMHCTTSRYITHQPQLLAHRYVQMHRSPSVSNIRAAVYHMNTILSEMESAYCWENTNGDIDMM